MNTEHTVLGLNASDWALLRLISSLVKTSDREFAHKVLDNRDTLRCMVMLHKKGGHAGLANACAALRIDEASQRMLWEKLYHYWRQETTEFPDWMPIENIVVVLMQDEDCS